MTGYDVFLSHAGADDALALDVQDLLVSNNISVFATPQSIQTGVWEPQIERALQNSTHMWLLLTPNALNLSTWVHHEFGYFYGHNHGRGEDPEGHKCHYLYKSGTAQPGLYQAIQGTPIDAWDSAEAISEIIAKSLGHTIDLPRDWRPRPYGPPIVAVPDHPSIGSITVNGDGNDASNDTGFFRISFGEVESPIFHVSALTAHPTADIQAINNANAVTPPNNGVVRLSSKYRAEPLTELPTHLTDFRDRRFDLSPGLLAPPDTTTMLVTFQTGDGRALSAIIYYKVERQQHGFPEIKPESPYLIDWRQGEFIEG